MASSIINSNRGDPKTIGREADMNILIVKSNIFLESQRPPYLLNESSSHFPSGQCKSVAHWRGMLAYNQVISCPNPRNLLQHSSTGASRAEHALVH